MRIGKAKLVCVGAAAGMWLAGVAEGSAVGIEYVTQDRSVSASSSATGFARAGTDGTPVTDLDNHSQQASGFGEFSGSTAASSNVGPQSAEASGSASQDSTLGTNGFNASGAVRADSFVAIGGPAVGSASTEFHITFDVTSAEKYSFTASLNSSNDFAPPDSDSAKIELTDSSGTDLFSPITATTISNFQAGGTLTPGLYSLLMDISATSSDQSDNFVNYNFALTESAASSLAGAEGPVASPVPLPSALTNSLAMLGGLGLLALIRRRLAGWARRSMI